MNVLQIYYLPIKPDRQNVKNRWCFCYVSRADLLYVTVQNVNVVSFLIRIEREVRRILL